MPKFDLKSFENPRIKVNLYFKSEKCQHMFHKSCLKLWLNMSGLNIDSSDQISYL